MTETASLQPEENKPDRQKEADNNLVFSYMTLRNLIGFGGIILPIILFLTPNRQNEKILEPSISDYYYTASGDILVVVLSILGMFLFTYKGYSLKENLLTLLAGICAIGVAFSPTNSPELVCKLDRRTSIHSFGDPGAEIFGFGWHLVFAATFLVSLAIMSLVFFPKSDSANLREADGKRKPKAKRNIIYKICGWVMLGAVLIMGVYLIFIEPGLPDPENPVIFIFESVAVWAFGISWLTKGQTILPDKEHYLFRGIREALHTFKK